MAGAVITGFRAAALDRLGVDVAKRWRLVSVVDVDIVRGVYAAESADGERAAVHVLHPELAARPDLRSRFFHDLRSATAVQHRHAVVPISDGVMAGDLPYVVTQPLEGELVAAKLAKQQGVLPVPDALRICRDVLGVLVDAHARGVVHADLRPETMFATDGGAIKVMDFGLARLRELAASELLGTVVVPGSTAYAAPEQCLGGVDAVGTAGDLFAVGAVAFAMLTGRSVHEGEDDDQRLANATTRPPRSLAVDAPDAPVRLVRVVDRAVDFDAARRFDSAETMKVAIDGLTKLPEFNRIGASGLVAPSGDLRGVGTPHRSSAPVRGVRSSRPHSALPPVHTGPVDVSETAATLPRLQAVDPYRERVPRAPRVPGGALAGASAPAARSDPPRRGSARPSGAPRGARGTARPPARDFVGFNLASTTPEDAARLGELFTLVDRALVARTQYGADHPEWQRRFDRLCADFTQALAAAPHGLAWNVTPYAFVVGDETIWEPQGALQSVTYELFADGIRLLGVIPGLREDEFAQLLRVLTLDVGEMSPDDDLVTVLWDAAFDHVVYQAVDMFVEGDQDARREFEDARQEVIALAHFDTSFQLEDCWQERARGAPGEAWVEKLARQLAPEEGYDAAAMARANRLEPHLAGSESGALKRILAVDPDARATLAARVKSDAELDRARVLAMAVRSYADARARGHGDLVVAPLRSTLDGLADSAPGDVAAWVLQLVNVLESSEHVAFAPELIAQVVSGGALVALVRAADADSTLQSSLASVLTAIGHTHQAPLVEALPTLESPGVLDVVLSKIAENPVGVEGALGALFVSASPDLGLALVRVLRTLSGAAAAEALARAAQSPHALVRIEALAGVEGASGDKIRLELRSLLEDSEPDVRMATLKAVRNHAVRAAGPFLVMRIKSADFDKLPDEEKRQSLLALAALMPSRAEAVCVELLTDRGLVASQAHDTTRVVAAETLATISQSSDALKALEDESGRRWRNSVRVREAAGQAAEIIRSSMRPGPPDRGPK